MSREYQIYILTNQRHTVLYIGVTSDLARRVFEHKTKVVKGFTQRYNLEKLIYAESFDDIEAAIAREKQLKKWTRAKKVALIAPLNPDWQDLAVDALSF